MQFFYWPEKSRVILGGEIGNALRAENKNYVAFAIFFIPRLSFLWFLVNSTDCENVPHIQLLSKYYERKKYINIFCGGKYRNVKTVLLCYCTICVLSRIECFISCYHTVSIAEFHDSWIRLIVKMCRIFSYYQKIMSEKNI